MKYRTIHLVWLLVFTLSCMERESVGSDPCDSIQCGPGVCIDGLCECPEGFAGLNCEQNLANVELLLKSIKRNDIRSQEFEYRLNGSLLKSIQYDDLGELALIQEYSYDESSNFLTCFHKNSENDIFATNYYFQNENGDVIRERYDIAQEFSYSILYSFFQDCGISASNFVNAAGSSSHRIVNLIGQNCDRTDSLFDPEGTLDRYLEIETDGKNDPRSYAFNYFVDFNIGNTTKFEFADLSAASTGAVLDQEQSYESVYSYNVNSYPISEVRTYYNGLVETYTYEYY